ncbi:MAG: ferrochelatase [Blastocatellia bacterium]|nr:ferrochelatase [Blastocatellia bacterium]MCS7156183.1 ferrochelatase [Blastocatellia bacterium]MCX7751467.1 ferrochelatase [Blastocatellia bacterium]MDW8169180.1 ferrochelatase [Acidobacteriota bacterium]MDW8256041.1 ferrochelatase [Acidobacteriota bacterium]
MPEHGIVLLNLGGPDSQQAVEPFLRNLFSDPDIFRIPMGRLWQRPLARAIAKARAPIVARHYAHIGGRSPILMWTQRQAALLEQRLRAHLDCRVYIGMRYWHPFIEEAVRTALEEGVRTLTLLPLYPQFSFTTTGSSLNEFHRVWRRLGSPSIRIVTIRSYPDHPLYVRAVAERIEETVRRHALPDGAWALIFSAHSLPVRFIEDGDPYLEETKRSVEAVLTYLRTQGAYRDVYARVSTMLAFQSRVGPVRWLEPSTIDVVKQFARDGIRHLVLVPISFVSDHIETLYELGHQVREIAREHGILTFALVEALNDSEMFAEALKQIVLEALRT